MKQFPEVSKAYKGNQEPKDYKGIHVHKGIQVSREIPDQLVKHDQLDILVKLVQLDILVKLVQPDTQVGLGQQEQLGDCKLSNISS